MTLQPFLCTLFLTLTLGSSSCNAQVKNSAAKDSLGEQKATANSQTKIVKNHLYPWPDEYLFIQCGLQDKAGNMWFGSAGDGIYFFDGTAFTNFTARDGLCHNDILCCMEDTSGIIWFGTRNGLMRYKPSGKKPQSTDFTSYWISENIISNATHKKIPAAHTANDNFVWSMLQDKTGKIWFGSSRGVYLYDPVLDNGEGAPAFVHFLDNDNLINKNHLHLKNVSSMLEDRDGNIWLVSNWNPGEGICRFDGRSLTNFTPDSLHSFRSIIERKNGNLLFLNGFHGIYSYDGKTFTKLPEEIGIKNGALITMIEDREENLWFGTNSDNMKNGGDGGVLYYNGTSTKLFTTKEGLSHNCVFCIVTDREGNIWFGTRNTGLCRYNGTTFTDYTD